MGGALDGLLELAGSINLGQTAADGAGLLWAEVKRHVLLVLVEQAELCALVGVDDGQDLGDGLADIVAVWMVSDAVPLTSTEFRPPHNACFFLDSGAVVVLKGDVGL